jgi:hypothetical protein
MAKYKVTSPDTRIYPSLGLVVEPDTVVDLDQSVEAYGLELIEEPAPKTSVKAKTTDPEPVDTNTADAVDSQGA